MKIYDDDDIDQLCGELENINHEKIIQRHFVHAASSDLRITQMHACELYVSKFDFGSVA